MHRTAISEGGFAGLRSLQPRPLQLRPLQWAGLGLCALAAVAGCADSTPAPSARETRDLTIVTLDGLVRTETEAPGVLFVKPDHQIGSYDAFQIEDVEISYRRGERPLGESDEERLRAFLHESLVAGIEAAGLPVVDQSGECVVSAGLVVTNLEVLEQPGARGSTTMFVTSWGEATVIFELRDSESREALLRFGQRRTIPGGPYYGQSGQVDWHRVEQTFQQMLRDLGSNLNEAVPTTASGEIRAACQGSLARAFEAQTGQPIVRSE